VSADGPILEDNPLSARAVPSAALAGLRLGIICSVPATRAGNNRLLINHAIGRLLEALLARVPGAKLCLPLLDEPSDSRTHVLDVPADRITSLPPLASVMESQRYYFQTRRALRQFSREVDILFVRVPFQVPTVLRNLKKPKLMHVISNPKAVIDASSDYRGLTKVIARMFAAHSMATMRRMAAEPHTRVVSNGQQMYDLLQARAGRVVVSSCLYEREMRPRTQLKLHDPPRLLFVSYLRPEKGAHTLLDAFETLRKRRPLALTLVGGVDKTVTHTDAEVREQIAQSPFRQDIDVRGVIEFGEELFDLYRSHDLYVLPSLSEGTPRTLVEARSFGCPVIATRVGGIPSSVEHGRDGWLITPNRPDELAAAIERILDDEPLRLSLIEEGLRRARRHSLERFADELVDELAVLAPECRAGRDLKS
jgi:glycosyltransferase involved in cell wall biosynthesis